MIPLKKRLFWIEKGYTVLLEGRAGCGKTAITLEAFREANLKFAYFSGSTLDPFIDFCGVPVKIDHPDGESSIKLILPEHMKPEETEAIMLDEYNRAPKKVRNALLELIQFQSINGRKFGKLRVIWVAINPYIEGDEDQVYDVERLDPAQKDRFMIQVQIPYKCSDDYFVGKYGNKMAKAAIQWWNDLPDKIKDVVSPRRLDYALQVFNENGDIVDVLPEKANAARLKSLLGIGPAKQKLQEMIDDGDVGAAKFFLSDPNNYTYAIQAILESPKFLKFFLPAMEEERISSLLSDKWVKVKPIVFGDIKALGKESHFYDVVRQIAKANQHDALGTKITRELKRTGIAQIAEADNKKKDNKIEFYYAPDATDEQNQDIVDYKKPSSYKSRAHRGDEIYKFLLETLPPRMTREAAIAAAMILQTLSLNATSKQNFYVAYPLFGKMRTHVIIQLFKNNLQPQKINMFVAAIKRRCLPDDPSVYDIQRFVDSAFTAEGDKGDEGEAFQELPW